MKRPASVSGQFYYGSASKLNEQVSQYIDKNAVKETATGILVPHAGLVYSGAVAGAVYSSITIPKTFLMLGPNHTGLGHNISIMDEGTWEVPNGTFPIDRKLASKLILNAANIARDSKAHMFEHSLEVQLPFLACVASDIMITPISILSASFDDCIMLAEGIAKAIRLVDHPVVITASSDMSHYLPDKRARQQDRKAIDKILAMDPEGLYETVIRERISMCGYLPATVMLLASKLLGADSARLVKYMTSGDISGDYESVVGYAGIVIR